MARKKVLLMGRSGVGKTSMRSIIFANHVPKDTSCLGPTYEVEQSYVKFLDNLVLTLWDCGGQDAYMESYFKTNRESLFRNVAVLIYVFAVDALDHQSEITNYQQCLDGIIELSNNAQVFCLVHKMDLIQAKKRESTFETFEREISRFSKPKTCTCFMSSIWDDTLYKAWSSIIHSLVPNITTLETALDKFARIIDAQEVLMLERSTMLVICYSTRRDFRDKDRFEKSSNLLKQFKLSCNKSGANFVRYEVHNPDFSAFVDELTPKTYIFVVMSDPQISSYAVWMNIKSARSEFRKVEEAAQDQ